MGDGRGGKWKWGAPLRRDESSSSRTEKILFCHTSNEIIYTLNRGGTRDSEGAAAAVERGSCASALPPDHAPPLGSSRTLPICERGSRKEGWQEGPKIKL